MIRFSLRCSAGHDFEGWFRNSVDFEKQVASGHLSCPGCGTADVHKALMAPNVSTSRAREASVAESTIPPETKTDGAESGKAVPSKDAGQSLSLPEGAHKELVSMLRKVRDAVIRNTDDVGGNFAEEARKMHYGEAEKRGIRGQTEPGEVAELAEEGIRVLPLPVLPEDKN